MQAAFRKRIEDRAFSVETIGPLQIVRSRLFIPEIIDSATSMG